MMHHLMAEKYPSSTGFPFLSQEHAIRLGYSSSSFYRGNLFDVSVRTRVQLEVATIIKYPDSQRSVRPGK